MVICNYFLQGRCRYGDRCWNEHPRGGGGGGRQEQQSRYHYQQPPAGSRTWTSSNQRYVQPSNFSKSTTWSRDNSQTSYAQHSDSHDNRSRHYNSGSSAGSFSTQNRFSTLPSQDHSKDIQSDKDGSLFEDIKRDLDVWESSGQWIFSVYCVSKDTSNATGFADISPEELRLEFYTARDSGNMQNYVNSVQQLATQWKQRIHAIKNANISAQTALVKELTKPAVGSAPMFGGQQNSSFPTTSSSASSAPQSASSFSFKPDSQAPSAGPISSFPTASGFANKPAIGFSNAVTGSAASFTFAVTTASDGASSGFNNAKAVSASTFSFAPTTTSGAGASAFTGFGAATTALSASTSSHVTGAFGGTTAASGFGQSTTSGFGGTTVASGFGQSTTSGVGGTTAASGFGQSTTSGFGGTTAASGLGQSATSGFGGTTASGFGQSTTSGFGGTAVSSGFGQSSTSVFGGGLSTSGFGGPAANTVTSGFGAKTSAVSDLFKTGAASSATTSIFLQASGVSVSRPPSVTSTSEASSKNPVFTRRSELSDKELSQFQSKRFSLGNIPIRPPPADLLKAG
ncbi:nucleoporin NUP42 [Aquarana catesbeiana]|uniref:nucleoporin NUP42 n=1 Tax=Aquarana catesbeiana TaxID=8400 RepID=UPI003CCA2F2E